MKTKITWQQVFKISAVFLVAVVLLSGCSTQSTSQNTKSSTESSSKEIKATSKKRTKTDLTTIPLVGKWKNSSGVIFDFQDNGHWVYRTTGGAKTEGTYQLAGAYDKQILLKIHGLDQSIGGIGNYLGLALSKKNKTLFIVGFGQFTLQGKAANIGTANSVRVPAALNHTPTTAGELLVGTWMNTDESAETQLTTNFDPNGAYQRYNSATKQTETGAFKATIAQDDPRSIKVTLTNRSSKMTTETYAANDTWTQLTISKNKVSTTYVKNQMPNNIQ